MVTTVVIPLIRPELGLLRSWLRYCPPSGVDNIRLVLSIDTAWHDHEKKALEEVFARSPLAGENWSLGFYDAGLSPDESFYEKNRNAAIDLAQFPYGQKSGPNLQFFRTLHYLAGAQPAGAVLLLEVDAFPLREGWLELLAAALAELPGDYLLVGARYQGVSDMAWQLANHVNGNAVYNLAAPGFQTFLQHWEHLLLAALKIAPFLAYDIVIEWYLNNAPALPAVRALKDARVEALEHAYTGHCHPLDELLVNLGGAVENADGYQLDMAAFQARFPKALVVHGKCFLAAIYRLRFCYAENSESRQFQHPLNRAVNLLNQKCTDAALFSGRISSALCDTLVKSPKHLSVQQKQLIQAMVMRSEQ